VKSIDVYLTRVNAYSVKSDSVSFAGALQALEFEASVDMELKVHAIAFGNKIVCKPSQYKPPK
jgi:hypothetical protein